MTLLARRYAAALHALAGQHGAVDAVARDLAALHADLQPAAARALLTSPDVPAADRQRVLQKLGQGRHTLVQNLLGVLHHRHRLDVLFDLQPAFRALVQAARGEVDGVVETPYPLGPADLEQLTALAARLTQKRVALTVSHRPELLGGVRLRVGNVLFDGSLQAQLGQLEAQLLRAKV